MLTSEVWKRLFVQYGVMKNVEIEGGFLCQKVIFFLNFHIRKFKYSTFKTSKIQNSDLAIFQQMVICLLVRDAKWWEIVFEAHFCFVANQEREFRKGDKLTPPQRAKRVIKGEG